MASVSQSARRVFWNATKITDGDFSAATELGTLAPGAELPLPEVLTADGFGFTAEVGATIAPNLMVYGTSVEAALTTAKDASPPTYGYLHVVNANLASYSWYWAHPVQAYAVPRQTERQRPMVSYGFFGESDSPEELVGNVVEAVTFE
jgi:hypothetical protein